MLSLISSSAVGSDFLISAVINNLSCSYVKMTCCVESLFWPVPSIMCDEGIEGVEVGVTLELNPTGCTIAGIRTMPSSSFWGILTSSHCWSQVGDLEKL